MRAMTWFKELSLKRKLALMMAPGALALGTDAAVSHFAGREMAHAGQLVPVFFAPLATALLAWAGHAALTEATLRRVFKAVGLLGLGVGVAGTAFHLRALARLLEGPLRFEDVMASLAVAPPLFAPASFAALGGLLIALGNPRLELNLKERAHRLGALRPAA